MNELARGPIDLNLFRVFDAVYRAGSITCAAALFDLVGRPGLEPGTYGLKVRSSTD